MIFLDTKSQDYRYLIILIHYYLFYFIIDIIICCDKKIPSLNILLNLLKIESTYLTSASGSHQFSNNHYYHVVEGLIDNENFSEPLKTEFVEKYWNTYDDLRFYFLKNAS